MNGTVTLIPVAEVIQKGEPAIVPVVIVFAEIAVIIISSIFAEPAEETVPPPTEVLEVIIQRKYNEDWLSHAEGIERSVLTPVVQLSPTVTLPLVTSVHEPAPTLY